MEIVSYCGRWVKAVEKNFELYVAHENNSTLDYLFDLTAYDSLSNWEMLEHTIHDSRVRVFMNENRLVGFKLIQNSSKCFFVSSTIEKSNHLSIDDCVEKICDGINVIYEKNVLPSLS
ncbi:hypothetical protein ACFQ45_13185 [Rhodanobacter aciditrophus]|uniref:Uncharacterized protein n=1 Tax=Rhodanobacter aciditrophus TaxID=1623218 RepID=A0ABW4B4Z5_9GAMM